MASVPVIIQALKARVCCVFFMHAVAFSLQTGIRFKNGLITQR